MKPKPLKLTKEEKDAMDAALRWTPKMDEGYREAAILARLLVKFSAVILTPHA